MPISTPILTNLTQNNQEKATSPELGESEVRMKLSLMRRQLQNDYTMKVKNIIQHLVLKDPSLMRQSSKKR